MFWLNFRVMIWNNNINGQKKIESRGLADYSTVFFLLNWPLGQFSPNVHLFVCFSVPSCGFFFWFLCIFSKLLSLQKYVGSARALLPGKFLRVRNFFCTEHTFVYYIRNLSGKSLKFLESFWIVWKISRLSWMFRNCLENCGFVWKFFV